MTCGLAHRVNQSHWSNDEVVRLPSPDTTTKKKRSPNELLFQYPEPGSNRHDIAIIGV